MGIERITFDLWLNVRHYTGCWGGRVAYKPGDLELDNGWLSDFMKNAENPVVKATTHAPDSHTKDLPGKEYTIKVKYWGEEPAVIVTVADGKFAFSYGYDDKITGKGLFRGYKVKAGKSTLSYTCTLSEEGYGHMDFKDNTFVVSHLFPKEGDFSKMVPLKSAVIFYRK